MRSSSCLPARDWNSTKPPYWMNEGGLGLKTSTRDFEVPSAVSGFREVRKKRKAKSFFSWLRTSANTENSRLTREIPLVPRVKTFPSDPRAKRGLRTSRVPSKQKRTKSKMHVTRNWMQRNWCTFFSDIFRLFFCYHVWLLYFLAPLLFFFFCCETGQRSKTQCLNLPTFNTTKVIISTNSKIDRGSVFSRVT